MTTLTGAMVTDQAQPSVLMFNAIEIVLPSYTLRLLDGAGSLTFGGHTFTGRDATYGVLGGATAYTDGVDDQAPEITVNLLEASLSAQVALSDPAAQGSAVSIWTGDVNPATGAVIADPDLAFLGELDTATWKVGQGTRAIELSIISIFDRFFDQDEGSRLNNGFHQSTWTGETGLEFVTQVQLQIPWGSDAPRPYLISHVPDVGPSNSGIGGGGGFFGPSIF